MLKKNRGQRHVFVGIEHLLRSDPAQEEWSKLHKCGYKVATDTARATREGQDVGWATSGVLVVAVANNLTSVVPTVGGRVDSVEKMMEGSLNPGSSVRRVSIFASTCGTKNGWTVRNEELMKAVSRRVANTTSQWIIASDANMEPFELKLGDWYSEAEAQVEAFAVGVVG